MSSVADPEIDPSATYAVDPALVRRLVQRVVAGPRAATRTTVAPATGSPIAALPLSTPDDVRLAVDSARAAQRAWASRSLADRARVLLAAHDLVLNEQSDLLDLIQIENGKARAHAFEEVADVAIVCRHYARRASAYLRPRRRQGAFPLLSQATELRHPVGVVGIIVPWNYPLTLAVSDAVPALLAGNAVVLKPDTQTALTALRSLELFTLAGVPEGLVQVVLGDGPVVGSALVDHVDHVSFTGSTATGRVVAQQAAGRLIGASLELGGKNPLYVAEDADLERAAEGAVRACFSSTGQLCISAERMYLHHEIADTFLDLFVARVRALRLGASLDYTVDMGSLTSERQLDAVVRHVDDAKARGATVLAGGRPRPDIGPLFYEPTVLEGVTPEMRCYGEETFGPVVSVYRVRSDDEAVQRANEGEYGLNASVWTRDTTRGKRIAARIKAGTVNVNEGYAAAWGSVGAPMGGMGASGLGRRHGAEGILAYTESQNVTVQHLVGFGPPFGLGSERWAGLLTTSLRLMKRFGVR
ncbi:MAG TPA: succinic semialdehyde dehydrogenase [Actinomycetales bacterium]|nr:succinic semialdehyde dehydrogenase [Actinomycetales bacterium]